MGGKYVRLESLAETHPTKVFYHGKILFVPQYDGPLYVAPGGELFSEEQLYRMGAKVGSYMLWKRPTKYHK